MDRGQYTVLDVGLDNAVARRRVRPPDEPVAVGDWVTLDTVDPDRIGDLAERTTVLQRGAVGAEGRERLIASTLDVVFVVSAFVTTEKLERRSLNPRRMERCVTAVREGSGTPVAVLNKADLPRHDSEELGDVRRELSARLGVNVVCVSAETRLGLDELRQHLTPDDTVAFVGPSGVGKSSLINVLLDQPALDVDHVRQTDAKGRHTTSHRELLMIPGGALLVDTPGMREFAVLSASGETTGFDDIQALASACRFSDCAHETEPGCAVVAATERGELLADRLASFHALQRDARRLQAKHGALVRHITHKKDRRFRRLVREAMDLKTQ